MVQRCKGLNSKCFLFTYLMIVGFLLVLWMNRLPLIHDDSREIPADLAAYLASPPRHLPAISLQTDNKLNLTNDWFLNKWSFVYFSHINCLPDCNRSFKTLTDLKAAYANNQMQFLVVGLNQQNEPIELLSSFLDDNNLSVTVATGDEPTIENLARTFIALFLKTDYSDGSYVIEQEHHLFLVDPKGRVYATFQPPYSATLISTIFPKIRTFYAKTE